jgi:transcriptional regulator with XRE-family HTH domain
METFGNFVKTIRIERNITLRNFCKLAEVDPSNWSKIERELAPPPKSKVVLDNIAQVLSLRPGKDEYYTLFDLAIISFIPKEMVNENELKKLPVFFRTTRGDVPTEQELRKLLEAIKD